MSFKSFETNSKNKNPLEARLEQLSKQLEAAGGIETSLGKVIGSKIDEIESQRLKETFNERHGISFNKDKDNKPKQEANNKRPEESVSFNELTLEEKHQKLNEKMDHYVKVAVETVKKENSGIEIKKKDFDYHFDNESFFVIDKFNPNIKISEGKKGKNISQSIIEKTLVLNPNLFGLDFRNNPFGDYSRLNAKILRILSVNKYIKAIKLDLTDIDEEDLDELIEISNQTGFKKFIIQVESTTNDKITQKIKDNLTSDVMITNKQDNISNNKGEYVEKIPVGDICNNFKKILNHIPEHQKNANWVDGIVMIFNKFNNQGEYIEIPELLDIYINLKKSLSYIPEGHKKSTPWVKDLIVLIKKIKGRMSDFNITEIGCVGKKFDANTMEAIETVEDNNIEDETVLKENNPCFKMGDEVVMHGKVSVSKKSDQNLKNIEVSKLLSSIAQVKEQKEENIEKINDYEISKSNFAAFDFALFLFKQKAKSMSEDDRNKYINTLKEASKLPKKNRREFYINEIKLAFTGIAVHKKADLDAKGILFLSKLAGLNFEKFNYEKFNLKGENETEDGSVEYLDNSVNYIDEDGKINKDIVENLPNVLVSDLSQTDGLNVLKTKGSRYESDYFMSTLDHHSLESVKGNCATKQMFELLIKLGLINEDQQDFEFIKEIVNLVNREDDKYYKFVGYGDITISDELYRNSSKTLYGYIKFLQPHNLENIYNCESLKKKYFENNSLVPLEFIELTDEELKEIGILDKKKFVENTTNKLEKDLSVYNKEENIINSKFGKIFIQRDFKFTSTPTDVLICNGFDGFIKYSDNGNEFFISIFGDNYPEFSDELNKKLEECGVIKIRGMLKKVDKTKVVSVDLFNAVLDELEDFTNSDIDTEDDIQDFEDVKEFNHNISEDNLDIIDAPYVDNSLGQVDFLNDKEGLKEYAKDCMDVISSYSFNKKFPELSYKLKNISEDVVSFRDNIQTFMLLSNSELFEPVDFIEIDNKKFYFSSLLKEKDRNDNMICFVDDGNNIYSRLLSTSEIGVDNLRLYTCTDKNSIGRELLNKVGDDKVELVDYNISQFTKLNKKIYQKVQEITGTNIKKIDESLGDSIASLFSLAEDNKQNPYSLNSYTIQDEIEVDNIEKFNNFVSFSGERAGLKLLDKIKNFGIVDTLKELQENIFNIFELDKLTIPDGLIPNFESGFISRDVFDDVSFGKVVSETFSCVVNNKPAEVVYMTNSDGKVWVDDIRYKDSSITTYGTNKNLIPTGVLTSLPLVKKQDNLILHLLGYTGARLKKMHKMSLDESLSESEFINSINPDVFTKEEFRNNFENIYNEFKTLLLKVFKEINYKNKSDYIDMTKFLENLNIIKQYKESNSYKKVLEFLSTNKKEDSNNYIKYDDVDVILDDIK